MLYTVSFQDALVKWTFVIFVCLQAIQSRAQMAMGYGGYGGVMMQPPVAMPMPVPVGVPMAYPQQDQTTTTTKATRNGGGGGGGGGYGTIVIPIPQFVTVTFKIPNANDGRDNNQDSCENHNKGRKDRKCQKCPPCSCNPCTPVVFAFCSPCHDQCKCKGDESSERRRTSTPSAPNGNAYPMPYPPVIYLPLPDFNKNNGKRPGNKCPKCESSSSCSSSISSCEEDSCNSRSRGKKKNHDHHRGHKKKVPYDICRKNGECGDNSQELRRFQVKRGPQVAKKRKPSYKVNMLLKSLLLLELI